MTPQQQQVQERKLQQKQLKEVTEQVELDARYFRAQFERKFYFIKLNEITPEHEALVAKLEAEQKAAQGSFQQEAPTENAIPGSEFDEAGNSIIPQPTADANTEG